MSAISVGMGLVSNIMQVQAQNAQADYQNALRANNIKQAKKTHATQGYLANKNQMEQEAAASQKAEELQLESMKAKGYTMAAAENNGLSLDALMKDYDRQKLKYLGNIDENIRNTRSQTQAEKEGISADAAGMIDSVAPAAKASPAVALFGALGSALDAYSIYWHKKSGDVGSAKKGA